MNSVSGWSVPLCGDTGAGSAWAGFVSGGVQACPGIACNMFLTACQVPAGGSPCSTLTSNAALFPLYPCCVTLWLNFTCICILCGFGLPRLSSPIRVWECIIKSWLFPAVFSLHFLCTNFPGNDIKSKNEIKNAKSYNLYLTLKLGLLLRFSNRIHYLF